MTLNLVYGHAVMISAKLAVDALISSSQGTYSISKHWTTQREFTESYKTDTVAYTPSKELNNKVLSAYVPHEWINK